MKYQFRAELPGTCATCVEAWEADEVVLLTAGGVVHEGCEDESED